MTYDIRTRAHIEFEISKLLFESDMKMTNGNSKRFMCSPPVRMQDSPSQASHKNYPPGYLCQSFNSSYPDAYEESVLEAAE